MFNAIKLIVCLQMWLVVVVVVLKTQYRFLSSILPQPIPIQQIHYLLKGEFALTEQGIGLKGKGTFTVSQDYPESDASVAAGQGETVRWKVPGETAVVLRIRPAK